MERRRSAADERRVEVFLTGAGTALSARATAIPSSPGTPPSTAMTRTPGLRWTSTRPASQSGSGSADVAERMANVPSARGSTRNSTVASRTDVPLTTESGPAVQDTAACTVVEPSARSATSPPRR